MLEIIYKKITEIQPYGNNPRDNRKAVEPVAESIREFGFRVPIIIDGDGTIVAGHTRYEAAKLLGLEQVPCVTTQDLTPEKIKAFRIIDNKTSEFAKWDKDQELLNYVMQTYDLTPRGIIEALDLLNVDYEKVAEGCHFYGEKNW